MTRIARSLAPALLAASLLSPALAAADTKTKAVFGFDFSFGTRVTPEVFAGLQNVSRSAKPRYNGLKGLAYWDFSRGFMPSKVKLVGIVDGRKNWQPELGIGYSLTRSNPFFSAGVSGNRLTGGVEFDPNNGLAPYVGVQVPKEP